MKNVPHLSLAAVAAAVAILAAPLAQAQAPTPKDPKSPLPGHVDGRGPTAAVELKITEPKPDQVIALPEGATKVDVAVKFDLKGYETFQDEKTKTGQHVHVILDNRPYEALYDATKTWTLKNVTKGTHTVRAFPSRPWHESIKEAGAFALVTFHVGEKDGKNVHEAGQPLLTYSRPKGKYPKAMAEKILLDWYVGGCKMAPEGTPDGCQVRFKLDDQPERTFTSWEAVWLEGVAVGKHKYTLALSRDGKLIQGPNMPFNVSFGFFEVEGDTPAAAPQSGTTGTAAPGPGGGHDH